LAFPIRKRDEMIGMKTGEKEVKLPLLKNIIHLLRTAKKINGQSLWVKRELKSIQTSIMFLCTTNIK
jgi:hypothetical protein